MQYGTPETIVTMLVAMAIGFAAGWMLRGARAPAPAPPIPGRADATRTPAAIPAAPPAPAAQATDPGPAAPPEPADPTPIPAAFPEAAEPPAPGSPPALSGAAALQRIRGIGPKSAEALAAAGIDDLAALAAAPAEPLAAATGVSAARIVREDWSGQARALLDATGPARG